MGEKEVKRGEEKNKPESGPTTVVLKVPLHCKGCAQKAQRSVKRVDGVESVSTDMANNKLTVVGKMDPVKLRERVEQKMKKKVEIVSPAGKAAAKPKDSGSDYEKQNEPESGPTLVVLKVDLHCKGCAQKVQRSVKRVDGVESVSTDMANNKLTMVGNLDPVKLRERVEQKPRKKVEIISSAGKAAAKPKDGGGDTEKPAATTAAGDGGIGGAKEMKMPAEEKAKSPQTSNAPSKIRLIQMIRKKIYEVKGKKKKETGGGGAGKEGGGDSEKKKEGEGVGKDRKEGGGEGGEGGDNVKEGGKAVEEKKMHYGMPYGYWGYIAPTPYYAYCNDTAPTATECRYKMASASSEYRHEAAAYQMPKGPAPYWYGAELQDEPDIFSDENPNGCIIM